MARNKSTSKKSNNKTDSQTTTNGEDKKPKRGRKKTRPETTNYSTRFDESQRDLIEQAARIKQWSTAQLIREAAIRGAADVINAAPPSQEALHKVAKEVAEHFFNPKGTGILVHEPEVAMEFEIEDRDFIFSVEKPRDFMSHELDYIDHLTLSSKQLKQQTIDQLVDALQSTSTEFAQILLYEIEQYHIRKRLEGKGFIPKVDVGDLLGRTDHTPSDQKT